jgi:Rrf2 family transcriptional regulator, cysteine metabolism repressor
MKLLTKDTDYAVRALLVLARGDKEYVSAREISETERIPYSFMRKILLKLFKSGYVDSREGGKGGFKLKKKPSKVRLVDLIHSFQGNIRLSECMFRSKVCHNRATCILRKNINRIEKIVEKEFEKITIESLLKGLENEEEHNKNK